MSTTLRKLQSITNFFESKQSDRSSDTSNVTVKRQRLRKPSQQQRSNPTLHDNSIDTCTLNLRHQQSEHPLSDFRRRLARKASTFSLRTRRRQGERDQEDTAREEEKLRELLSGSEKGSVHAEPGQEQSVGTPQAKKAHDQGQSPGGPEQCQTSERPLRRESSVTTIRVWDPTATPPVKDLPPPPTSTNPSEASFSLQELIRKDQEKYITHEVAGGKTSVKKMASEQAPPPVPYTRLKEITETVSLNTPLHVCSRWCTIVN